MDSQRKVNIVITICLVAAWAVGFVSGIATERHRIAQVEANKPPVPGWLESGMARHGKTR